MPPDIILRDVIDSDYPILYEQQLDPEATEMAAFPPREWDAFMAHWAKILKAEDTITKVIEFEGKPVGSLGSWLQDAKRYVGYWIGKEYWGKGIATKGLEEFLDCIPVRPIYAYVARHNIGSQRVLQKCGFAMEAEEPEEFLMKLGG